MRATLPPRGLPRDEIFARMRAMSAQDIDWRHGRTPLYVFKATDEIAALGRDAYFEFFTENGLGGKRAFHGLKRMEDDVVAMGLSLFDAPAGAAGYFTTGGSESIVTAIKACRDFVRGERGQPQLRGNIVLPSSAHPGVHQGRPADGYRSAPHPDRRGLSRRRVRDGKRHRRRDDRPGRIRAVVSVRHHRPDRRAGRAGPSARTVAARRCVRRRLSRAVRGARRLSGAPFDFGVPGVQSISADLHKFGFCPKPASTVFYRTAAQAACQPFEMEDWPSGRFVTATIAGTRPGGAIAGAWATLNAMGESGYVETARAIMALVAEYRRGIEAIGLRVVGRPDLSILCFTSDDVDMLRVGERMGRRGWLPGLVREPHAMHLMLSLLHQGARDDYLRDLRECVAEARAGGESAAQATVTY